MASDAIRRKLPAHWSAESHTKTARTFTAKNLPAHRRGRVNLPIKKAGFGFMWKAYYCRPSVFLLKESEPNRADYHSTQEGQNATVFYVVDVPDSGPPETEDRTQHERSD